MSIPFRQSLARLTLPVLIAASFAVMLLGRADPLLVERVRMGVDDLLVPLFAAAAGPLAEGRQALADLGGLYALRAENARLHEENAALRRWQAVALALDAENASLKAELHWSPDPAPRFITARVVADAGGAYARSVLIQAGPAGPRSDGVRKGEIALDDRGLVGRITEIGSRSARILLITDMNSRIPVTMQGSGARAILVGTNGQRPRLLYWPEGQPPQEGERIVTSAEASAFPAGLPVGTVHYSASNAPEVATAARLDQLQVVRVFDYGLGGDSPPVAASAEAAPARQARAKR